MRVQHAASLLIASALALGVTIPALAAQSAQPEPAASGAASTAPMMAPATTAAPHGSAHATATPAPAGSQLVRVASCSTKNFNPMGGPGYVGYVPGQAVSSYWPDQYSNTIYQPSVSAASATLLIEFTNISHKPMTEIEFGLLKNQLLSGEARDDGTFEPGATIKHKLGLQVSALLPGDTRCVPLHVVWADGTKWRNPRLPKQGKAYFNSKIPPKPFH